MQLRKNTVTDSTDRTSSVKNAADETDGEYAARLFKYHMQFSRNGRMRVPLNRISAKAFHKEHSAAFDGMAAFFSEHGLDMEPYVRFFVTESGRTASDIDTWFFSKQSLSDYAAKLQAAEKKKKIYGWFMKSVGNIVNMCVEKDYMSGKDCILALMRENKLASEYVSGRISRYFFAAMPNFRELIPKLDGFARNEFADLYDKFDLYNTEINDAFILYRNRKVNPLAVVDSELAKIKRKTLRA